MKNVLMGAVVLTGVIVAGVAMPVWAEEGVMEAMEVVDVGNKICPVMGTPVPEGGGVTLTYEGKVYHFCCPGCVGMFQQDPAKYIAIVEKELAAAAAAGEQK